MLAKQDSDMLKSEEKNEQPINKQERAGKSDEELLEEKNRRIDNCSKVIGLGM